MLLHQRLSYHWHWERYKTMDYHYTNIMRHCSMSRSQKDYKLTPIAPKNDCTVKPLLTHKLQCLTFQCCAIWHEGAVYFKKWRVVLKSLVTIVASHCLPCGKQRMWSYKCRQVAALPQLHALLAFLSLETSSSACMYAFLFEIWETNRVKLWVALVCTFIDQHMQVITEMQLRLPQFG